MLYRDSVLRTAAEPLTSVFFVVGVVFTWVMCLIAVMAQSGSVAVLAVAVDDILSRWLLLVTIGVLVISSAWLMQGIRSGQIFLDLMHSISRTQYYGIRLAACCSYVLAFYTLGSVGFVLLARVYAKWFFGASLELPADTRYVLLFGALTGVSIVCSLSALSTIASSSLGHLALWLGLMAAVIVVGDGDSGRSGVVGFLESLVREGIAPFLVGPAIRVVRNAASGWPQLAVALAQWACGAALAIGLGTLGFSRLEIGRLK